MLEWLLSKAKPKKGMSFESAEISISYYDAVAEREKLSKKCEERRAKIINKIKELFKVDQVIKTYDYSGEVYAESTEWHTYGQDIKKKYISIDGFYSAIRDRLEIRIYGHRDIADEMALFVANLDGYKKINIIFEKEDE